MQLPTIITLGFASLALAVQPGFLTHFYKDTECTKPGRPHTENILLSGGQNCITIPTSGAVSVKSVGKANSSCVAYYWTGAGCTGGNLEVEYGESYNCVSAAGTGSDYYVSVDLQFC